MSKTYRHAGFIVVVKDVYVLRSLLTLFLGVTATIQLAGAFFNSILLFRLFVGI